MFPSSISVTSVRSKQSTPLRRCRSLKPIDTQSPSPDHLLNKLLKFRIDGRTINARNVDEIYPGLDRLLLRCLQTGDYRQIENRFERNLKAEYLLITGRHIHLSVCAHTEDILEKLIALGATLDLHFYEPIHRKELELLCKYGFDINERLTNYNNQTPLSIFLTKNYSISMLDVLIENGARFDLQDNQGQTCLHIACQSLITDSTFEYLINHAPDSALNLRNQFGSTPLDLLFFSTYEHANFSRMRRLHILLSRQSSKLTRCGMREPNLLVKKQYQLFDIISCKEFLFKYRLRDLFDSSTRPLSWCIFLFYDVLRACEQRYVNLTPQAIQQRLEHYLISMIENGEISLEKLIFRPNTRLDQTMIIYSPSATPTYEFDHDILTDTQNSLLHMAQIKSKLSELRHRTLTLKALCRIKIKKEIRNYPNDIVRLHFIPKILQGYLTYYNPFVKSDTND